MNEEGTLGKRGRPQDDQGRETSGKKPKIDEGEKLRASSSSPKPQYDAVRRARGAEMGSRPVDGASGDLKRLLVLQW